jgi:putative spermidine/putrescine transport system substrate-binding protein
MAQALKSGECWACVMWQSRGVMWQNAGIPIEIAFPDGPIATQVFGFGVPKNARNKAGAYKFFDANFKDDTQVNLSRDFGFAPALTKSILPEDYQKRVGLPKDRAGNTVQSDNDYLLKNDAQLKDWWDRSLTTA